MNGYEEGIEVVSRFIDFAFVSTSNCCEVGQILVLFVDSLGNLFSIAESIATTVKGSSLNHFYNFLSLLRDILSPLIAFHNLFLAFKLKSIAYFFLLGLLIFFLELDLFFLRLKILFLRLAFIYIFLFNMLRFGGYRRFFLRLFNDMAEGIEEN